MQNAEVERLACCQTYFNSDPFFSVSAFLFRLFGHFYVTVDIEHFYAFQNYADVDGLVCTRKIVIEFSQFLAPFDRNGNTIRHWK